MSLSDVLSRLFGGIGDGLNTYMQVKGYEDETAYRHNRDALEDEQRQEAIQRQLEQQSYEHRQDYLNRQERAGDRLGIYGVGSALESLHKAAGNQTQSGSGTGEATALPSALEVLQRAQAQADFNPRKQQDLGNGMYWQGPEFGKSEPRARVQKYVGADGRIYLMDLDTGASTPTEGVARTPGLTAGQTQRTADDEAEGLAILNSTIKPGSELQSAFGSAYSGARAQSPTMAPGRLAKQVLEGLKKTRPDLFSTDTGSAVGQAVKKAMAGSQAPQSSARPAGVGQGIVPDQETSGKRVVTADQAEYLKAIGQWDPTVYEVR